MNLLILAQQSDVDRWWALGLALTGLLIVFTALILISLFIALMPRVLGVLARIWPETDEPQVTAGHPESQVPDNAAVLAAIGFVLHTEMQKQLAADQQTTRRN